MSEVLNNTRTDGRLFDGWFLALEIENQMVSRVYVFVSVWRMYRILTTAQVSICLISMPHLNPLKAGYHSPGAYTSHLASGTLYDKLTDLNNQMI